MVTSELNYTSSMMTASHQPAVLRGVCLFQYPYPSDEKHCNSGKFPELQYFRQKYHRDKENVQVTFSCLSAHQQSTTLATT